MINQIQKEENLQHIIVQVGIILHLVAFKRAMTITSNIPLYVIIYYTSYTYKIIVIHWTNAFMLETAAYFCQSC